MLIGGSTYSASLNMTLIKNTETAGYPLYIPYTVKDGPYPSVTRPVETRSMSMTQPFTVSRFHEAQEHSMERELLHKLALKHGIMMERPDLEDVTLKHRVTEDYHTVEKEDHNEDVPPVPKFSRLRSMTASSFL